MLHKEISFYLFTMHEQFFKSITKNLSKVKKKYDNRVRSINVLAHKTCIEYFRGFKY